MHRPVRAAAAAGTAVLLAAALPAWGQAAAPAAPASASAPAAASAPAQAASQPASQPATTERQRVEVSGQRSNDTEQRRQSTAAKIVIGREEIERFGDATVGEILRRLPGVTSSGPAGRGGPPRMRGLGGGYTQILLDGERVPPGFSIESISPEQIERIEILRAPTAETGARAMAGTINIITREGFAKKVNDLRVGVEHDNGRNRPSLNWSVNGRLGERWNANLTLSYNRQDRAYDTTTTTLENLDGGSASSPQQPLAREVVHVLEKRNHLNIATRWQWLGEDGDSLMLSPFIVYSDGSNRRQGTLDLLGSPSAGSGIVLPDYQAWDYLGSGHFGMARFFGQYRHRLGDTRLEWRGGAGAWRSAGQSLRTETGAQDGQPHTLAEDIRSREQSGNLTLKATRLLDSEHSLVGGLELEQVRRSDSRGTQRDGVDQVGEFGDDVSARTLRSAAYLQDEWQLTPQWAAHAGLRWEAISTRSTGTAGSELHNRSSVWTPLLHALWRPEPKSKDQVRVSLTRSYRAPSAQNLLGRPTQSAANSLTRPDRAGNPDLQPELATGIDLAYEHYLGAGGVLSANLFRRNIQDLIRNVTALETDSVSGSTRWVSRPRNIGDAVTQGLELEAKFRLTELLADAPPLDLRSNLSLYSSRVKPVPGPDNRLDQQAHATFNLGLDYRLRGLPLMVGGNLNWTPGYVTRLAEDQWVSVSRKRVLDAYLLWTLQPGTNLRLSASNLAAEDHVTASTQGPEASLANAATYVSWQLRLEMKL